MYKFWMEDLIMNKKFFFLWIVVSMVITDSMYAFSSSAASFVLVNAARQSKAFIDSSGSKCYQRLHGLLVDSFEITRDEIHKSCIKNGVVNEAAKRWREEAILNYKFVGTALKTGIIADIGFHPESLEHMRTYMNFDFAEQLVVHPVDKVVQLSNGIRQSGAIIEGSSSVVASSQQAMVKPLNLIGSALKLASDNPMAVGILVATTTVFGYCAYYKINPVKKIKNMVNQVKNQLPVPVKA